MKGFVKEYNYSYETTTKNINFSVQPILLSRWWAAPWSEQMKYINKSLAAQKRYANNSVITSCIKCEKEIKVPLARFNAGRGKYCSKKCFYASNKGIRVAPQTEFKRGVKPWNNGKPNPKVAGIKNINWRGDNVSYSGLHKWVHRNYEWEKRCTNCDKTEGKIDLANITGVYVRAKENWTILCRACHIQEDRRNPKRPIGIESHWS